MAGPLETIYLSKALLARLPETFDQSRHVYSFRSRQAVLCDFLKRVL